MAIARPASANQTLERRRRRPSQAYFGHAVERVRRWHLGHVPPVVTRALVGALEVCLEAAEQLDLRPALRRPELQPEGGRRVLGPVVPACEQSEQSAQSEQLAPWRSIQSEFRAHSKWAC